VPHQAALPIPTFRSIWQGTTIARVVAGIGSQPIPKSGVPLFAKRATTALFAMRAAELPGATKLLVLLYSEILHLVHLLVTPLSPPTLPYPPSCVLT
jgi:hypothetical protein